MMYERVYGDKHSRAEGKSAAEIAKLMRADIEREKNFGRLPAMCEVSITVENYSGGRSINPRVLYRPEYWIECDGIRREYEDGECREYVCGNRCGDQHNLHGTLTELGQKIKKTLTAIHWAYNHDGSEIQTDYFDVSYYGHVEFEDASSAAWHAKERARLAERRENADERRELIAFIAAQSRGWMKPGNLRHYSTEKLRAYRDQIKAREGAA